MKITINNKEMFTTSSTLLQLAGELALPASGVAMALNNRMIPRADWGDTPPGGGRVHRHHQSSL